MDNGKKSMKVYLFKKSDRTLFKFSDDDKEIKELLEIDQDQDLCADEVSFYSTSKIYEGITHLDLLLHGHCRLSPAIGIKSYLEQVLEYHCKEFKTHPSFIPSFILMLDKL